MINNDVNSIPRLSREDVVVDKNINTNKVINDDTLVSVDNKISDTEKGSLSEEDIEKKISLAKISEPGLRFSTKNKIIIGSIVFLVAFSPGIILLIIGAVA